MYRRDWLGPLPPRNGIAVRLASGLLEVMSYVAAPILRDANLKGLRQCLREGWIHFLRLNQWDDNLLAEAAKLGLLSGPRCLDLLGGDLSFSGVGWLRDLTRLRKLILGGSRLPLNDEALVHLRGLTGLRELHLWSWGQLTGAGLAHLAGLTDLRVLSLFNGARVGDDALACLAPFPHLESLGLSRCGLVTDAGLARLAGRAALRELYLGQCPRLTNEGLDHLAGLPGLRKLDLERCEWLTDAGLAHVLRLENLEDLSLFFCTRLTGPALVSLQRLTHLSRLDLRGCKLRPHETRALRKALPDCQVLRARS
jgi:hypothetical protein